jgi:O-antigen biosynthesis protein
MRVLIANVYYPPIAFGGATIVAEQTTALLAGLPGVECMILCLDAVRPRTGTFLTRYVWNGVDVLAISPSADPDDSNYKKERNAELSQGIADWFRPDVALIHCVQYLGAQLVADLCDAGVPVAIFFHDAWWICERQFMINSAGGYCFQTAIDLNVCRYCVDDISQTRMRDRYLRAIANRVDARLFPSGFFRDLHINSGINPKGSTVVKNGVLPPRFPSGAVTRQRVESPSVRFGFLGGLGPVKGATLIEAVFKTLSRSDYELVCVDNLTNLGQRSNGFDSWKCTGKLRVRAGFTQETIDDFYDEIDVLLCPSQWKESFGLAVREALIRHKWVIATAGGGLTEDVVPGVNGTIIPLISDPEPLRNAVLDCFDKDWARYRNPRAHEITTFAQQTEEIYCILTELIERKMRR